jgi:hypothetical protein
MAVKGGGGVRGEGQRHDVEVVAGGGSGVVRGEEEGWGRRPTSKVEGDRERRERVADWWFGEVAELPPRPRATSKKEEA